LRILLRDTTPSWGMTFSPLKLARPGCASSRTIPAFGSVHRCRPARRHEWTPAGGGGAKAQADLKVLSTTGYARNAIVHDGRLDAGVDLITMPFSQAALAEKLRDIIDAKREPGRILLVEDETLIQMLAAEYLEGSCFTVHVAGSASEAMNTLGMVPGSM
jgi:CheY-like chemotaxis protein